MIFIHVLLLFLVSQLTNSSNNYLTDEISFNWNNEDVEDELEVIDQSVSSIDEDSFDIEKEMMIIELNTSPIIECITRELFRIYEPFCYRRSYGRGAGYPLNACPTNAPDKSGLICYPKCRDGYIGIGPVCWEDCGSMTTVGIFCVDSNVADSTYYDDVDDKSQVIKSSCSSCPSSLLDSKDSYKRIFVRKSYGRGAGSPMTCSSQYEKDGALCYNYCDKRYYGVGPVCWQYCPTSQPTSCGFGCSITSGDCTKTIIDMFATVIDASMMILRLKLVGSFIEKIINNFVDSATKNDWISVSGNMSILSNTFAETILSDVSKKCNAWPLDTLESATKNVSLLFSVTAFNDMNILRPFLKLFDIDNIVKAFDHALCNLRDDSLH